MKKRVISLLLTIIMLFSALSLRLFRLSVYPETASLDTGTRTREIDSVRGTIFDRSLIPLTNNGYSYKICINPSAKALDYFRKANMDKEIIKTLQEGNFVIKETDSPTEHNNIDDVKILQIYKTTGSTILCHVLGYTDETGNGVYGIEKHYNELLQSMGGTLEITYSADAQGRVMSGEDILIRDNGYYNSSGVALTIDKRFQEITENALYYGGITKGAAIILDTTTNKILACASTPVFDKNNLSASLKSQDAPFINRAFSAFSVGSVFKTITAATALENNVTPLSYTCTGSVNVNGTIFNCNNESGHGEIQFNDALSKSCNSYFIELGLSVSGDKIIELSHRLHFGEATDLGNGYTTSSGILPEAEECKNDGDVANLSFGQGRLTATPLQIATLFSAIGNGGYYVTPTLIEGTVDSNGTLKRAPSPQREEVLKKSTCDTLKNALSLTTISGTGIDAKSNYFNICAKTATAQSGQFDSDGNEINICWFVGFFPKENPQYTICILKENGSSGGSDCGPVFKKIAEDIYSTSITR